MTGKSTSKAFVPAILAVLCWSTSPTAFKLGLRYQDSYQLLTGASLTSVFVLGLILLLSGKYRSIRDLRSSDLRFSALMGFLNPVAYYIVLFKAYSLLPAQVAQPLNMIWPIVLVLISIPMLKQSISWKSIGAMVISFAGVVLISYQGGTGGKDPENKLGIVLALSSSVLWALYFIFNTRNKRDPIIRLFLNFMFASLYLLAGGLIRGEVFPDSSEAWLAALYVGIFEMSVAFALWLLAMHMAPSTDRISNLVYVAPFLNLLIVKLVLDESIFVSTLYGIVLLVAGILIQNMVSRYARKTG
jgi:drug/metabolite transporter (DMT)-like permease